MKHKSSMSSYNTVYLARLRSHCPDEKDYSPETNWMVQCIFLHRLRPAELKLQVDGKMYEQRKHITHISRK